MLFNYINTLDDYFYTFVLNNFSNTITKVNDIDNKVTLAVYESGYFLYKYITNVFFLSFKFFLSFLNEDSFQNPTISYILTTWFKITNKNLYLIRDMDYNTFYNSIILDNFGRVNANSYDLSLKLLLPEVWFMEHCSELNFTFNNNYVSYLTNFFTAPIILFSTLKSIQFVYLFLNIFLNFIIIFYILFLVLHIVLNIKCFVLGNNKLIDSEQLSSSLLTESEKEIASINDILPLIISILLTFGLYFYINSIFNLTIYCNSYCYTFIILPIFFSFVFVIPAFLLFDFGLYAFTYLRGSGNTALLSAELLYDLINLFAYYIRVVIQTARIVLMLTALGSYQELIYNDFFNLNFLVFNDVNLYLSNIDFSKYSIFNFFFKFIIFIIYVLYEIFHTYFVLTIQTIAFFAMVFWLFFYLFSFFVSEQLELYFQKKRQLFSLIN